MFKYTLKFLSVTALASVLHFFTIGTVVGSFLTEGSVNLPLSLIFMVLNLAFFIAIWTVTLKSTKIFQSDMRLPYSVLEMNIPAFDNGPIYMAVYTFGNLLHILIYAAVITVICTRVQRNEHIW